MRSRTVDCFRNGVAIELDWNNKAGGPKTQLQLGGGLSLKEWAGYLLDHWASLQKIPCLIGPRRAGKGVIARVLRAVIGDENVSSPTLFSLNGDYGLWAVDSGK